jgi:putative heme degradation protein
LWYYREGGSEKHLRDIAAMLQVSGNEIDQEYVNHWAQQLGLVEEWRDILNRLPEQ